MSFVSARKLFPAVIDTLSYSCFARGITHNVHTNRLAAPVQVLRRQCSTVDTSQSENDVVSPLFTNRNPRNLERMAIARKPKGWNFQYPSRSYYHRLRFEKTNRFVTGWVEHNSGRTVITASTKEFAVAKHLYSLTDVSAAKNVGRILARRCLEAGIDCMNVLEPETGENSEKFLAFRDEVLDGGVDLSEPEEVKPLYEPGIDYEDEWETADLERRQKKVAKEPRFGVFKYGQIRHKVKVKKYRD